MDDRELEKLLTESADKVQIRGFSSRWKEIKKKMSPPKKNYKLTLKYFTAMATGCCLLALAVILPFVLRPENEVLYFLPEEAPLNVTTEEQFFYELNFANFEIADFSSLQVEEYFIARSSDQVVRGGRVAYNNSDGLSENIFTVTFYSSDIILDEQEFLGLANTVTIESTEVVFRTTEGDLYESRAYFVYKEVSYIVEYTSLNNDLLEFLSTLIN